MFTGKKTLFYRRFQLENIGNNFTCYDLKEMFSRIPYPNKNPILKHISERYSEDEISNSCGRWNKLSKNFYHKSEVKTWGFKIHFEIRNHLLQTTGFHSFCRISWKKMWIAYEFCKVCVCFLQRDSPWEEYMGIIFLCFQTALNANLRLPHPTDWKVKG